MDDTQNPPIPAYDEENAKHAMEDTMRLVKNAKNLHSEDEDFEANIKKFGWSHTQLKLFAKIMKILDMDRLARLGNAERPHEPIQRRTLIDKSAERFRKVLASVQWETTTVQWLHGVLMENLPPSYLAAYLDIMQCLKHKLPSLVDKMIFWKPGLCNQELLAPILKKPWQPIVANKVSFLGLPIRKNIYKRFFYFQNRKLPGQVLIVVVPSAPKISNVSARQQKILHLFATMASVLPVQVNIVQPAYQKQHLQAVAEQMISVTRTKIQELRAENPERKLILVGFNSGAALALQVALVEQVAGVVCFGFAFNTVHGPRGNADDHILDLPTPVMFLIGQNSARSSQEEIEGLRERMIAPTSLVVIGSADDCLRVSKIKRKIEKISQEMVDNMILDEIAEFSTMCLTNPPAPKTQIKTVVTNGPAVVAPIPVVEEKEKEKEKKPGPGRKRKISLGTEEASKAKIANKLPTKTPKPTLTPAMLKTQPTGEALDMAVQSILPENEEKHSNVYDITTNSVKPKPIVPANPPATGFRTIGQLQGDKKYHVNQKTGQKMKYVHLKAGQQGTGQKFYTLKSSQVIQVSPANSRPSTPTSKIVNTGKFVNIKNSSLVSSPESQTSQQSVSFSPQKFTILKTPASTPSSTPNTTFGDTDSPDLTNTSIMDIPIVFADSDGNIEEDGTVYSGSDTSFVAGESPKIVYKQPVAQIVKKNVILNKGVNNKVVVFNKAPGTIIKSGSNVNINLTKGTIIQQPMKYVNSKIVVTNPKMIGEQQKAQIISIPSTSVVSGSGANKGVTFTNDKKIEILNNQVIKPAGSTFQSVRINMDGTPISTTTTTIPRNFMKLTDGKTIPISRTITQANFTPISTTSGSKPTIVIRSNTLKPFPGAKITNTAVLNRNLTVKRVSLMPQTSQSQTVVTQAAKQESQLKKIILKKD